MRTLSSLPTLGQAVRRQRSAAGLPFRPATLMGGMLVLSLLAPAPAAEAGKEIVFEEANLFIELNDTDGDLGLQALIDGEAWKRLKIFDPNSRRILDVVGKGRLNRQGLTELSFESDEPTFDEFPAQAFFARFPEGRYRIEARTESGDTLVGSDKLSHVLPAPADSVTVSGIAPLPCDTAALPAVSEPLIVEWDPVTTSHPSIGEDGPVDIVAYNVFVERKEPTPVKYAVELAAGVTQLPVPETLTAPGDELKLEIQVEDKSGNLTDVERCFVVGN